MTRPLGPTPATVDRVITRDEACCAWCGYEVDGERGFHWSVSHRRPRGMGGDRRPETNASGNLVLLHGSGVTRCHGWIESHRTAALAAGQTVLRSAKPDAERIDHAVHGWVYLDDDGGWVPAPPGEDMRPDNLVSALRRGIPTRPYGGGNIRSYLP